MRTLEPSVAAELVRRIVAGDARAEAELAERCDALRFLARRLTRSEADAEDLYQDTLMLALEKIRRGEVDQPERLAGFLRALVKNLGTQRYRRRHYGAEVADERLGEAEDRASASPLRSLLDEERSRLTRRMLAELGVERDREVLFRYYIAEESSRRICADLEIDGDHFYRVLSRARQRYRKLWEGGAE